MKTKTKTRTKTSLVYKAIDNMRIIFRLTNWPKGVTVEAPREYIPKLRRACNIAGIDSYSAQ